MAVSGFAHGSTTVTPYMLLTMGLALVGQIVYHIGQRAVPREASPLIVLAVAYFVAGLICVGFAWPLGALTSPPNLRSALAWPTWVIAIAIVAIELGYLLAYRSGWSIGNAFAITSTLTVFALALLARFAFGNPLTARQLSGLAVSCLALWLLSTGPRAS